MRDSAPGDGTHVVFREIPEVARGVNLLVDGQITQARGRGWLAAQLPVGRVIKVIGAEGAALVVLGRRVIALAGRITVEHIGGLDRVAQLLGHHRFLCRTQAVKAGIGRRHRDARRRPGNLAVAVVNRAALQEFGLEFARLGLEIPGTVDHGIALRRRLGRLLRRCQLRRGQGRGKAVVGSIVKATIGVHGVAQRLGNQLAGGRWQSGKRGVIGQRGDGYRITQLDTGCRQGAGKRRS